MSVPATDDVVRLCHELIRLDTSNYGPGGDNPGERVAAEYVARELDEVGIHCDVYESEPRRTTLVARWEPDGCDLTLPPLLVHGHLDVVPAKADDWQVDPFSGEVRDGCVWGRGAVDMKDFDAMVLAVVRERQRQGRAPRRPVRLAFTADEEAGSVLGARWLVDHHPETVADCTDAIGEVGGFSLGIRDDLRLYLIQTAEKGLAWLNLIADGTAGHGSMRNDDNPVTTLASAVATLGNHRWPQRLHPAQRAFLDAVEDALGVPVHLDSVEETLERLGSIARMVGATLGNSVNPTMLAAGYKHNVIPGRATAGVDARFIPGFEEELYETVRELVGPKVSVEVQTRERAVETEFETDLVAAMTQSLTEFDPAARTVPYLMSAGTDAKGWADLGIRCYGFVPLRLPHDLDFVGMFHGVDERVPVESLQFGVRVLDRFLDLA